MWFLRVLALAATCVAQIPSEVTIEPLKTNAGVIFTQKHSAILSANSWILVIEYPLDFIRINLEVLHDAIQTWKQTGMITLGNASTIHLEQIYDQTQQAYNSLITPKYMTTGETTPPFLPASRARDSVIRRKRGLINFAGYLSKLLFGTATQRDINRLNQKIQTLSKHDQILKHSSEYQMSLVKKIRDYLSNEDQRIIDTVQSVQVLLKATKELAQQTYRTGSSASIKHSSTMALYNQILTCLNSVHLRITDIRDAIHQLDKGYLDPLFMTPHLLQKIMQDIRKQLPAHANFVLEPNDANILQYYQWKIVSYIHNGPVIHCLIHIPLMTPDESFNIYQVSPFPIPTATASHAQDRTMLDTNIHQVAITPDLSKFVNLPNDMTSICIPGPIKVCPVLQVYITQPKRSCLFQLFTARTSGPKISKCTYIKYFSTEPELLPLTSTKWALSIIYEVKARVSCLRENTKNGIKELIARPDIFLNNSCILNVPLDCTLALDTITIPLRLEYSSNATSQSSDQAVILPIIPQDLVNNLSDHAMPARLNQDLYRLLARSSSKLRGIIETYNLTNVDNQIPLPTNLIWNDPTPFTTENWNAQDVVECIFIGMFTFIMIFGIGYLLYKQWMKGIVTISPPTSLFHYRPNNPIYNGATRQIATYPRFREYTF